MVVRLATWLVAVACLTAATAAGADGPARIVSTSPGITETLFALGLGDRVVGVSRYCHFPERARSLPKVGTFLKPDAELIARLTPELVVVHRGPADIERQLATLRIPVVTVERGTLGSIFTSIRAIGRAADAASRADALVRDIEGGLDRVRRSVVGRPVRKAVLIVGRRPGSISDLVAAGKGSYLSDILAIAGGVNVLATEGVPEYPRISVETIVRLAPDVIVDLADMQDSAEARRTRQAMTEGLWRQQRLIPAATAVHAVISEAFTVPGPRVVEVAETFAEWLHGVTPR